MCVLTSIPLFTAEFMTIAVRECEGTALGLLVKFRKSFALVEPIFPLEDVEENCGKGWDA